MRTGLTISAVAHLAVLGIGLVAFTGKPFETKPQESLPVDIITADQLSQITKGSKTAKKDAPQKPLVEKIAPEKPVEDTKAKVSEKKEIATAAAPEPMPPVPQARPLEKQPDVKPEPPKDKPKEEPKKADAPDDKSKVDPIADQLKKEKADKPKPKQVAEQKPAPKPQPKQEQKFDADKIAALIDKRAPQRNAATGETLNATASLGTETGQAKSLTLSWVNALQAKIAQCWNVPAGVRDAEDIKVRIYFELKRDGTVSGQPQLIGGSPSQFGPAVGESGIRAIQQCQPYNFLPQNEYAGGWDKLDITFSSKDMFRQ